MDCVGDFNARCDLNNRPYAVSDCNYGPCPEWKVGEWQEVANSTVIVFCCCCCCFHVINVTVAIAAVVVLLIVLLFHQKRS